MDNFPWIAPSSNPIVKALVVNQQQVEQGKQGLSLAHYHHHQHRPNNNSSSPPGFNGREQAKKLTWASIASQPVKSQPSGGSVKKSVVLPLTPSTATLSIPPASLASAPLAPVPTPLISNQKRLEIGTPAHVGVDKQVNKSGPSTQQTMALPPLLLKAPLEYEAYFGRTTTASNYNLFFGLMELNFLFVSRLVTFGCVWACFLKCE